MDIFDLRNRLVKDYADYIQSFILIRDDRIREHVDKKLTDGFLWPDPLIQLNPSFESGEWIGQLVEQNTAREEPRRFFRIKENPYDEGRHLRLHRHKPEEIKATNQASLSEGREPNSLYQTPLDPPPGLPCYKSGNFIHMKQWDPDNWPSRIHRPRDWKRNVKSQEEK